MTWAQAICTECWDERNPDRPVNGETSDAAGPGDDEYCCWCGEKTSCGIYVREDPTKVPYPRVEDGDE